MVKLIIFFILVNISFSKELEYKKPNAFDFITYIDDDFKEAYETSIDSNNLKTWGLITASTLLLIKYDKELIDEAQRLGKKLGIKPHGEAEMNDDLSIGPFPILRTTSSEGAFLYMIGDGTTHISITAGFFIHGMLSNNDKSLSVSSQLFEGLIDVALVTQTLKHITGRESPFVATTDTGKWRWFPNQEKYHKNVPKYDAFPSGHLATTMMTVTVLSQNYPDNVYIKPIGYTAMGLLSFQMMNNGVHWASDYPLALAIGYTFGKIVSNPKRNKYKKGWSLKPNITSYSSGIAMNYRY